MGKCVDVEFLLKSYKCFYFLNLFNIINSSFSFLLNFVVVVDFSSFFAFEWTFWRNMHYKVSLEQNRITKQWFFFNNCHFSHVFGSERTTKFAGIDDATQARIHSLFINIIANTDARPQRRLERNSLYENKMKPYSSASMELVGSGQSMDGEHSIDLFCIHLNCY